MAYVRISGNLTGSSHPSVAPVVLGRVDGASPAPHGAQLTSPKRMPFATDGVWHCRTCATANTGALTQCIRCDALRYDAVADTSGNRQPHVATPSWNGVAGAASVTSPLGGAASNEIGHTYRRIQSVTIAAASVAHPSTAPVRGHFSEFAGVNSGVLPLSPPPRASVASRATSGAAAKNNTAADFTTSFEPHYGYAAAATGAAADAYFPPPPPPAPSMLPLRGDNNGGGASSRIAATNASDLNVSAANISQFGLSPIRRGAPDVTAATSPSAAPGMAATAEGKGGVLSLLSPVEDPASIRDLQLRQAEVLDGIRPRVRAVVTASAGATAMTPNSSPSAGAEKPVVIVTAPTALPTPSLSYARVSGGGGDSGVVHGSVTTVHAGTNALLLPPSTTNPIGSPGGARAMLLPGEFAGTADVSAVSPVAAAAALPAAIAAASPAAVSDYVLRTLVELQNSVTTLSSALHASGVLRAAADGPAGDADLYATGSTFADMKDGSNQRFTSAPHDGMVDDDHHSQALCGQVRVPSLSAARIVGGAADELHLPAGGTAATAVAASAAGVAADPGLFELIRAAVRDALQEQQQQSPQQNTTEAVVGVPSPTVERNASASTAAASPHGPSIAEALREIDHLRIALRESEETRETLKSERDFELTRIGNIARDAQEATIEAERLQAQAESAARSAQGRLAVVEGELAAARAEAVQARAVASAATSAAAAAAQAATSSLNNSTGAAPTTHDGPGAPSAANVSHRARDSVPRAECAFVCPRCQFDPTSAAPAFGGNSGGDFRPNANDDVIGATAAGPVITVTNEAGTTTLASPARGDENNGAADEATSLLAAANAAVATAVAASQRDRDLLARKQRECDELRVVAALEREALMRLQAEDKRKSDVIAELTMLVEAGGDRG